MEAATDAVFGRRIFMNGPGAMGCIGLDAGYEPIELASRYTLSRVEGGAPPQLVGATAECDVSVVGGRILFESPDPSVPVPDDYFEIGLDVLKPWPINWLDRRVGGGFGIMIDDVLAGVYALIVLQLLAWWWQ
jgi:hypothetical protein